MTQKRKSVVEHGSSLKLYDPEWKLGVDYGYPLKPSDLEEEVRCLSWVPVNPSDLEVEGRALEAALHVFSHVLKYVGLIFPSQLVPPWTNSEQQACGQVQAGSVWV